jgi:hypothetical protein
MSGQLHVSAALLPGIKPRYLFGRRLNGSYSGLDDVERRKFFDYQDSNSDPSVLQSVASRFTDCVILVPHNSSVYTKINGSVFLEKYKKIKLIHD